MEHSIEVKGLKKVYGNKEIVKSVNFHVPKYRICAFLGPNGAGKSTTMSILSTLLDKSAGTVKLETFNLDKDKQKIKQTIGVVFQEDVLDRELTVYENLYFRGGLYSESEFELKNQIERISNGLFLHEILHKQYSQCSGGQRRIVQIARALLASPSLLILDEPTIGLDPLAREQVWDVLQRLNREEKMTIFFTTHYMEEVKYAQHVCMIKEGEILLCESTDHIKGTIEEVYMKLLKGRVS